MSSAAAARHIVSSVRYATVELQVFPGVGHGVFRQAPEQAFAWFRAFLSEGPPSANEWMYAFR
jgi:pimeloyl-ACP methyl ester carboxylesterase